MTSNAYQILRRHVFVPELGDYEEGVVPGRRLFLKAFFEKKSWHDARKFCQSEGGDLVIVDDERINNWLKSKKTYLWIGATDQVNLSEQEFVKQGQIHGQYQ